MRIINRRINELMASELKIGFAGENEHTRVVLDCADVFSQYPHSVPAVTVQPAAGLAYPAIVRRDGDTVIWDVTDSDLAAAGHGEIQVTFTENEVICKSCIGRILVRRSIEPTGEAPDPVEDWLVAANTALNAIPQTIDDALEAAKESGEFDGHSPEVTAEKSGKTTTVLVDGEPIATISDGEDGDPGDPGHSPVLTSSKSGKVTTIYSDGAQLAQISDGEDGDPGDPGHSPVLTSSKSGKVTTIYSDGAQLAQISDGEDGTTAIDDSAGSGDTDKVWSADKTADECSELSSAINQNSVEENLLRSEMPGTATTVTIDSNGNPTSIVHTANNATVRTDSFVWGTGTVTETRTLANGKYITITTNLTTLAQTISAVQEVA